MYIEFRKRFLIEIFLYFNLHNVYNYLLTTFLDSTTEVTTKSKRYNNDNHNWNDRNNDEFGDR